jgi:phosphoglycolate phosphatase-like HAD superfamily hydrolase
MHIFLFDIDGTLINTGGAGGAALREAFCAEFGVSDAQRVPLSGRTDRDIGRSLFELHGLADSAEHWQRLRTAYLQRLPASMPEFAGYVLPGARELLQALAGQDLVALGLLTGNVRDGARIKLEFFDLMHYFGFGGYGDDYHDRDHVAHEALRAAREHLDGRFGAPRVWVIGDTPNDVACGRAIQARVLAVATGIHPRAELEAASPDLLVDDLSDTKHVVDRLTA